MIQSLNFESISDMRCVVIRFKGFDVEMLNNAFLSSAVTPLSTLQMG